MAKMRETKDVTMKDRLKALGNLPEFFRLVWQAGPGIMFFDILLRIIKAAIPFSLLYVGKLIIDSVVALNQSHNAVDKHSLWILVGIEFGLAILNDGLTRIISL